MQSILIADDHDIVRFGLTMMLKEFFPDYIVDEAWDAESVIEQMRKKEYQLILLDLVMPNTDASILLPYIKNIHPIVKILILSMNDETLYGLRSIHLGAHGYLKKDTPKKEIAKAIATVLAGKKYVSQELADSLLQHSLEGTSISPFERLSPREFQVAMYLIKDFTQKQISEILQVQYGTVNTLKQRVYDKLEIGERKELNELASIYGLQ
ncbi:response regulator [Taibaiella koreensis]|uniref:response regulator n=1 Tax=Taibaiella koreensis TaxID=1268548 RepID=UPI000E5A008D|nr:response regulator transcription factor [Taibaiella koreensis]